MKIMGIWAAKGKLEKNPRPPPKLKAIGFFCGG